MQLHECQCGELVDGRVLCPECGSSDVYPVWNVYTLKGRCVGYVHATSGADAIATIQQAPAFDRYLALQPRPCMATPGQGPCA